MAERAQRSLGLDAERYAFLIEESGVVFTTHRPGDWAYTSVNARIFELTGYRPDELMEVPAYFFFHPEDAEAMKQRTMPAVHAHGTRTMRYRLRHKDGSYRWVESVHRSIRDADSGELKEVITVSRDLTAQREAELQAQRLAMATESSADLVLFCDQNFQISYMNGSARRAFSQSEDCSPSLLPLLASHCEYSLRTLLRDVEHTGQHWQGQLPIELADRQSRAQPIQLELQELQRHGENALSGEGAFYGLIIRDITEQRQAEQLERERQQELARAARLMTMGEMATGLAHEINQPLATILNYSRGALRRLDMGSVDSSAMVTLLQRIAQQAQRAADIIKRLRSLVKKTPFQRAQIEVNGLSRDVLSFMQHEFDAAGISVQMSLAPSLAIIEADKVQVEQVLINLLRNAIEAYRGGAAPPGAERQVTLYTRQCDDAVVLGVEDRAGGIAPARRERLFEPYYSSKSTGLGMGLPISRSIVEAHSGRIDVQSDGEYYSRFEVVLPHAPNVLQSEE